MSKKIPAFPLVREKEDVLYELMSARLKKAVPLVFSAATLSSTRCSPGFRLLPLSATGSKRADARTVSKHCAKREVCCCGKLLREIPRSTPASPNGTSFMYYLVTVLMPRVGLGVLTSGLAEGNVAAGCMG